MANRKDLETMIEALTLSISIYEREEAFFRRSAEISSSKDVRALFLEIAGDMNKLLLGLVARRQKLYDEFAALQKPEK